MEQNLFIQLVQDFLRSTQAQADPADLEDLASFDFTSEDGFTCRVFPHSEQERLFLEVGIAHLDFLRPDPGFQQLLLLHQINWAARWTTGIMAVVSEDMELVLSKSLDSRMLNGDGLAAEVALMLDAAKDLRSIWEVSAADASPENATAQDADASPAPASYV